MTWLTIQTALWCLAGFCVGALAAWLVAVMVFPHERDLARSDRSTPADAHADQSGEPV